MTDQLPPYSGNTATCPKCRGEEIDVSYVRGVPTLVHGDGDHSLLRYNGDPRECLVRTCQSCGWAWLEACADAPPVATGPTIEHSSVTKANQRLEPCRACATTAGRCLATGDRCCAVCSHDVVSNPMSSTG